MDFSNSAFQPSQPRKIISGDTMNHTEMVSACRFGWTAGPETISTESPPTTVSMPRQTPPVTNWNDSKTKRFTPCRGRLYHQLICSHKVRTDLVEDCAPNCLEPFGGPSSVPFYCHECVEKNATDILQARISEHNAAYPPMDQMAKEQYEQWYNEHRQLEAQFAQESRTYELQLKATTRATNTCAQIKASQEELDFAAEVETLSLAMESSNQSDQTIVNRAGRLILPNDASEQLHWSLNALSLERGSCGVEYSPSRSTKAGVSNAHLDENMWGKPGERN